MWKCLFLGLIILTIPYSVRAACIDTCLPGVCEDNTAGEILCGCVDESCEDICGDGTCQEPEENLLTCSYDCNSPPSINQIQLSANPVNFGEEVIFSATWSDSNPGDIMTLLVCNEDGRVGINCMVPFCSEALDPTTSNPISCSYTTSETGTDPISYLAFVCDSYSFRYCSEVFTGSFEVNHQPTITSASSSADDLYGSKVGGEVVFTMDFNDPDMDTAKIHVCKENDFSQCGTEYWCKGSDFGTGTRQCTYIVKDEGDQTNDYFVFAEDEHGFVSEPVVGQFFEDREYRIAKFVLRKLYGSRTSLQEGYIKIMNFDIENNADITLTLEGPGEFKVGKTRFIPQITDSGKKATFNDMVSVSIPPRSETSLFVSIPSLAVSENGENQFIILKAESSTERMTETDMAEINIYEPPSFIGLNLVSVFVLVMISIILFVKKQWACWE